LNSGRDPSPPSEESGPVLLCSHALGNDPALDLTTEEIFLSAGASALFIYRWNRPVLVLGYGQETGDVDLEFCRSRKIPVLRRISGGTGVFHNGDLSISLSLPPNHSWASTIGSLYARFVEVLFSTLNPRVAHLSPSEGSDSSSTVRSPICFEDYRSETILIGGKKAIGCAQARRKSGTLIHGTLLLHQDPALYARVFGVREERVARSIAPIPLEENEIPDLIKDLTGAFSDALQIPCRSMDPPEIPEELKTRYLSVRWNPLFEA